MSALHDFARCLGFDDRQEELGARPAPLPRVGQHDPTPVVLHDLLHDGKPKPRPLRLVRDVGLGEALALLAEVGMDQRRDRRPGLISRRRAGCTGVTWRR